MELQTHTNGKVAKAEAKEPKFSLLLLDAEATKKMWPTVIRPGLEAIKYPRTIRSKRTGQVWTRPPADPHSGHWIPEHVRAAIDRGHLGHQFCECHLIMPVSSDKPAGFIILRLYPDEFINVPTSLFVWIAYCTNPLAMKQVLPLVEKRAREIGVSYVEGVTSRLAWGRRLRKHGYSIHQVVYRKRIDQ